MTQIKEIEKLSLQDGDILLVKVPIEYTDEQISHIHDIVQHILHKVEKAHIPVLTYPENIEFKIIRKSEDETIN